MSKIEVDAIDKQSGSTLTLGGSGTAVTLACGATQSGFGRNGSVNWQTGSIKTSTFTAANGEGYFVDTSGGVVTANLPAGSAGAIVSFSDYTRTFNLNNLTVTPNGSEKIGGNAGSTTMDAAGQAATFVYVDGTEGWINVQETSNSLVGPLDYLCAAVSGSGNTTITDGDYKIAVFTGPGTFAVNGISSVSAPRNNMDWMVVGGGGAGGESWRSGGGGAGGFRESPGASTGCYTASPLAGNSHVVATATNFPIVVGAGGTGGTSPSNLSTNGSLSSFSIYSSAGGGAGGSYNPSNTPQSAGANGGSGGGGGGCASPPRAGGSGNTPSTSPAQGTDGGNGGTPPSSAGGGGGGATDAGSDATTASTGNGFGGDGAGTDITPSSSYGTPGPSGSLRYYSGGGGGGHYNSYQPTGVAGGYGGGGMGGYESSSGVYVAAVAGTVNTGGGGGGKAGTSCSPGAGNGGSGIVMIRYKFQN
jgi:hypothetical protein